MELKEEAEKNLERRIYTIYSKWIKDDPSIPQGSFVKILYKKQLIGYGFYEKIGPIGVRVLAYLSENPPDELEEIVRWRLNKAHKLRRIWGERPEEGYRLVYADSDGMPGLIIDVYGATSVLQSSSIGWDKNIELLASLIVKEGISERVYLKNDQRGRKEYGLKIERKFIIGGGEEREIIREGKAKFIVDFRLGQKTGFYLDQRPIRKKLSSMDLRGFKVLDLFSYNGSFSVHSLLSGAEHAILVEESPLAISLAVENLSLNGLQSYEIIRGRVEKISETLISKRRKYDLVIADPPAFIPSASYLERGMRAYKKLVESVLRLTREGGLAYISSCSYHLSEEGLLNIINSVSGELGLTIKMLFHNSPVNSNPFTRLVDDHLRYLKGYLIMVE